MWLKPPDQLAVGVKTTSPSASEVRVSWNTGHSRRKNLTIPLPSGTADVVRCCCDFPQATFGIFGEYHYMML